MKRSIAGCLAVVFALSAISRRGQTQPAPDTTTATRVVILGSGTPNPDPARQGPAVAVVVRGTPYLFDAGSGVVRRAQEASKTVPGLAVVNLSRVFITHLHSDHTIGLPDLMTTPWIMGRSTPLSVYGPPGTAAMVDNLQAAYAADREMRRYGGEPSVPNGYAATAHDVKPGEVYRDSNVTITAVQVPHGTWRSAYGYRIETPDRVVVISGDTRASEAIAKACRGCDVLVHEVYSADALTRRTPPWQAYHRAFHTSGTDLGRIANDARPKLLVLYHQLYWGATDDEIISEIRATFSGRVVSAKDLDVF